MPVSFDRTVVMEWLNDGQKIEKYDLQAWDGKDWRNLVHRDQIGRKKVDVFTQITARRVRLRILKAAAAPHVREFQIYDGAQP